MIAEPSKATLLGLLPYKGYEVNIGCDPAGWATDSPQRAYHLANRLKIFAEQQFPGLKAKVTREPNIYPSAGPDAEVMAEIDDWLSNNAVEVILGP